MRKSLSLLLMVLMVPMLCLLLSGCWFCQNRAPLMATFQLAQQGYSTYVAKSGNDNKDIILADQILAIGAPFVVGAAQSACPPDAVLAAAQERAAQLTPVPANPSSAK